MPRISVYYLNCLLFKLELKLSHDKYRFHLLKISMSIKNNSILNGLMERGKQAKKNINYIRVKPHIYDIFSLNE